MIDRHWMIEGHLLTRGHQKVGGSSDAPVLTNDGESSVNPGSYEARELQAIRDRSNDRETLASRRDRLSFARRDFGSSVVEPLRPKREIKVQPCSRVQDGHSAIEQAVYITLWSRGKPETDGSDTRIVHVGHAELMRQTSLVRNALKANLRSLADKQAIEMLNGYNAADNRPSGYRVRGYKDILLRRKAAGMVYVVRGRSVRFCDERGGGTDAENHYRDCTGASRNYFVTCVRASR